MARGKPPSPDYESRVFELLLDKFDKNDETLKQQSEQLAAILAQTQKTNGRVTKLEADSKDLKTEVFKKVVPWYSDKSLLKIAGVSVLVFLLIVAAVLRVDIPGGIAL